MKRPVRMSPVLCAVTAAMIVWATGLLLAGLVGYGARTGAFTVQWMPVDAWRSWRVGKSPVAIACCSGGNSIGMLVAETYSLGFVEVEVPHRGAPVVLWNTVPRPLQQAATVKRVVQ